MSIEAAIAALTAAVEKNTAAILANGGGALEAPASSGKGTGKGKGKGKEKEPDNDDDLKADGPTQDEMRASLFLVRDKVSRDKAKEIMKTAGGSDTVDAIPSEKYKAVMDACQKALKGGSDDDGL